MTKNSIVLLILALIFSVGIKLAVFSYASGDPMLDIVPRFGYMLAIILMLFFTIHFRVKSDPSESFAAVFKQSTKPAAIYVVAISVFTYLYYTVIDVNYLANRIAGRIQEARDHNLDEETIEKMRAQMETFAFNVDTVVAATLMGFLFFALISGAFLTLVVRKLHELQQPQQR